MTATEMVTAFKFGLDKFDSLNYPNFLPAEIDLLLNQAQDAIIKQRYGVTNIKKQSFEETQKRTEDIKNVVVRATIVPAANASDNINSYSRFVTLPSDHWIIIQELTGLSCPDCHNDLITDRVYTEAIQHNDYSKLISNPFGKPNKEKVLRLMENGRVELIPPSECTITNYYLTYIKKPRRINSVSNPTVSCELSEHTHQEIVNNAISIALEGIEARRTQTFNPITKNTEE